MRLVAVILAVLFLPAAQAEDRVILEAPAPAPSSSAVTVWRFEGIDTLGLWESEQRARKVHAELLACDELSAQKEPLVPWIVWAAVGFAVGGVVGLAVSH